MKKANKKFVQKNIFYRIGSFILYFFVAMPVLFVVNKLFFGLKIKGRENLKELRKTGGLTISNHVHFLDCEMVAFATLKKMHFVILYLTLKRPFIGKLVKIFGGVPTPSKLSEVKPFFIELSNELVENKKIFHIYPEGELIVRDSELRKFDKGVFRLSIIADKPIVPMLFTYEKRAPRIFHRKSRFVLNVFRQEHPFEGETPEQYRDRVYNIMLKYKEELDARYDEK